MRINLKNETKYRTEEIYGYNTQLTEIIDLRDNFIMRMRIFLSTVTC